MENDDDYNDNKNNDAATIMIMMIEQSVDFLVI